MSQNSQGNTCGSVSFLKKLQASGLQLIEKMSQAQVFSCEFCEISINTFLHKTPLMAASALVIRFLVREEASKALKLLDHHYSRN